MDKVLTQVVEKLIEKTRAEKVHWEDISGSTGGETFRLRQGEVYIHLSEGDSIKNESDDIERYFRIQILNIRGFAVAHEQLHEADEGYEILKSLFLVVRKHTANREGVLEKLLVELGK